MPVALLPPPPGVTPNFEHPEQHGRHVVILGLLGIPCSFLFLMMRMYTKIRLNRQFGSEDVCILLTWIISQAVVILIIVEFLHEGEGSHLWEVPLEKFAVFEKILLSTTVLYIPAGAFAKMALLLIFRRISNARGHRLAIHLVMFVVLGYSTAFDLVLIFQCHPIARAWDVFIVTGSCVSRTAIYVAAASLNIATDLATLLLPIPIILKLKLPLLQKVGLCLMFAVGSLTFITSIMRLTTLLDLFSAIDQTWALVTPVMWVVIEANLQVICCCLVSFKTFLRHHAPILIGEKRQQYRGNSYYETPRSKGLVITKDVSFNLTWQDENDPRSHHSGGYIEMDSLKDPGPELGRNPTSESQEGIMQPVKYPPAAQTT